MSAAISNVRYEITFDTAAARERMLRVAMSFDVAGDEPVLLSLPAWTPGAYEISNFARWVSGFGAAAAGRALDWDKTDPDTWRIQPAGARAITVSFDYRADTLDNAMAWTQPDFALFNGTTVFMYPEGRAFDWGATVSVRTEPAWLIATGMESAGAPRTFRAGNYHDLVDMPFFVGRFAYDSTRAAERWVRLATYPVGSFGTAERQQALEQISALIPPQAAVFGEIPFRDYTVLIVADSAYQGLSGLEHQNSHVNITTPLAIGSPYLPSLYSHEIFHAWNVKRLRPAALWPYRYDAPQPTELLWVSEGITDYYADLAMLRGGLTDSAGFLETTSEKITEVTAAPRVSLEDASLSTWIHPTDGSGYIYYPKGSLAGFLLDILIRDASDNTGSLDAVLRELYSTTYQQGHGFTNAAWWEAVSRAAGGRSFQDFHRDYIDGREPLPWSTVLPLAGLQLAADTAREPRIGVYTGQDERGIRVAAVEAGSAAAAAGVQPGDYLLSVGDIPVEDEQFGARFRAKYGRGAAANITLVVRRDDREMRLTAPLQFVERVTYRLAIDRTATPKAVRVRSGIFRGGS